MFGLGIATVLTLIVTPAALAARIWVGRFFGATAQGIGYGFLGRDDRKRSRADAQLERSFRKQKPGELIFENMPGLPQPPRQIPGPAE